MPYKTLTIAAVLALLAACDRAPDPSAERAAQPQSRPDTSSAAGASQTSPASPASPANLPAPQTQDEKREGANPTQGQVDPKEREQHRDFQQRGDGAGPRGPDTTPRN